MAKSGAQTMTQNDKFQPESQKFQAITPEVGKDATQSEIGACRGFMDLAEKLKKKSDFVCSLYRDGDIQLKVIPLYDALTIAREYAEEMCKEQKERDRFYAKDGYTRDYYSWCKCELDLSEFDNAPLATEVSNE
jgi:hypothetical protein